MKNKKGFDNRVFLLESEWKTYLKRAPVRYTNKKKEDLCSVCGKTGTNDNPLQNAHIIPFIFGVTTLALTPEYLDSDENIVTAHKCGCNKSAEAQVQ